MKIAIMKKSLIKRHTKQETGMTGRMIIRKEAEIEWESNNIIDFIL